MLYHLLSKCARHLRNLLVICLPVITAVGLICTLFAISVVFLQCLDTVGQQEGHPTCKNWVVDWWDAGMVICLEQGADLHMAQLMPLPLTVSCFRKIEIGFTFLVPAHLGSPGKRAVKRVCVVFCRCQFQERLSELNEVARHRPRLGLIITLAQVLRLFHQNMHSS